MKTEGDLEHTLSLSVRSPSAFLNFFQTRPLIYCLDELLNITHAAWVEPCMGSVFLSYYVAPAARARQKEKCYFLYDVIDRVFQDGVNCVVGIIQERETPSMTDEFIKIHERLGYTYSGRLPYFFDGKTAHLVSMSRRDWEQNNGRFKIRWRRERQAEVDRAEHLASGDHGGPNTGAERPSVDTRGGGNEVSGDATPYWTEYDLYAGIPYVDEQH